MHYHTSVCYDLVFGSTTCVILAVPTCLLTPSKPPCPTLKSMLGPFNTGKFLLKVAFKRNFPAWNVPYTSSNTHAYHPQTTYEQQDMHAIFRRVLLQQLLQLCGWRCIRPTYFSVWLSCFTVTHVLFNFIMITCQLYQNSTLRCNSNNSLDWLLWCLCLQCQPITGFITY